MMEQIEMKRLESGKSANFVPNGQEKTLKNWLYAVQRQLFILILIVVLTISLLINRSKEMRVTYVVAVMGILWMTEMLPLAITALLPVILYPVLGIVSAKDISTNYLTDANFVFFGSLIIAVAVEKSYLHERLALRILLLTGSNPRWLMLGFQVTTAFLSMWLNNSATTALMVPIAVAVIKELRVNKESKANAKNTMTQLNSVDRMENLLDVSKMEPRELNTYKGLLLSICYSSTIGGTSTLIGTGPNIILSGLITKFVLIYLTEDHLVALMIT